MAEAAHSRIVVAETGNKRTGITEEDVTQCIKDLASWLQTNAAAHYNSAMAPRENGDANMISSVLTEFSAAQTHLALSLHKFDGGMQYLDTYIGISIEEINSIGTAKGLKQQRIVPFAVDINGTLLCLQINDDGSDTVISYDPS